MSLSSNTRPMLSINPCRCVVSLPTVHVPLVEFRTTRQTIEGIERTQGVSIAKIDQLHDISDAVTNKHNLPVNHTTNTSRETTRSGEGDTIKIRT
jgi:hypothetical protein